MQQDQELMKQNNQDRRMKAVIQGDNQNPSQTQQQPQKCPRCDSLNTKFCYYNNYSLSQPRYFCKTCRRYWTQGGTLRNVPVGGGSRRGKRVKTSSSSSTANNNNNPSSSSSENNSRAQSLLTSTQNMIANKEAGNLVSAGSGISSVGSYNYSPGGFLMNSLANIQSLNNQPPSQSNFSLNHQPLSLAGGEFGAGTSNLSLLHGFNAVLPPYGSQQIQQARQFYHMGSHHDQRNWQQHQQAAGFLRSNNILNPTTTLSDNTTALWSTVSTSTTTTGGNNTNNTNTTAIGGGSFGLNSTDQWHHDLPGYGPPP